MSERNRPRVLVRAFAFLFFLPAGTAAVVRFLGGTAPLWLDDLAFWGVTVGLALIVLEAVLVFTVKPSGDPPARQR